MKFQSAITASVLAVSLLALAGSAFAQAPVAVPTPVDPTATPRIDQRQANQQKRINQGVASGQLTPQETANLQKRESKIAADEAAAKADGKVTKAERAHLRHEENRASRAIHQKKHNGKTVAPAAS